MTQSLAAPIATPTHGWTPERKVCFLDRLATHGNARAACRAVGLSAESAYRLRRRDTVFARAWNAAVLLGRDNSVEVLSERAVDGVEEEIWYRGEMIGTRRRYDSRLLLAHLARLDRLVDEADAKAQEWAGNFDAVLGSIAAGDTAIETIDREGYAAEKARAAVARMRDELTTEFCEEEPEDEVNNAFNAEIRYKVTREFHDELNDESLFLDGLVRADAREQWDALSSSIHALIDGPGPRQPPAAPAHVLAMIRDAARPNEPARKSFPCTASTVSTSALARGLVKGFAGPHRPSAQTPRSPWKRR